jgi:phosphotriesterase-related protein
VYVEYDSHFRWKKDSENFTYKLLENLLPKHSNRIVVGMDMARNTYWKSYGGKPGLSYLLTTFKDELNKINLTEYFEKLLLQNPQRLFSFSR